MQHPPGAGLERYLLVLVTHPPAPTTERIASLDVVRGFALWGVLLINMLNFVGPPSGREDTAAGWIAMLFFKQKSWRLFAFLFGVGFALQMARAGDRGFAGRYGRRLAVLLLFGLANYLFYFGDVLAPYALLGAVLLLARNWPPRVLVMAALALLALHPVDALISSDPGAPVVSAGPPGRPAPGASVLDHWRAQAERIPEHLDPRRHWSGNESWLLFFAMFLLGLYAGRRRLWDVSQHEVLLRRVFVVGFPLGFAAMLAHGVVASLVTGPLPPLAEFARRALWSYGATVLSMSYAAGLVLLLRDGRWERWLTPLGAMGRMTLTVYLAQSVIFTTLFFDYGLGLNQQLGPAAVFGAAALILAAQAAACVWWNRRYRFGPAEWLWRSTTYLKRQPFRR